MAKYLSLSWFKSKIDKVVDATVEKVVNQKVEKLAEQRIEELQQLDVEEITQVNEFANVPPVIYKINDVVTVILPSSGKTFTKEGMSKEEFEKLNSLTETALIEYFSSPEIKKEIEQVKQIQKENEIVQSNFETLRASGEFEIKEDSVYMKGINRSIPKLLVNKFTEVIENAGVDSVNYLGLKKFWLKCVLNPSAQSSEDLYEFLEKHNMKITRNGNFLGYRAVEIVDNSTSKELIDFISNAYNKVKAVWKKSSKNYSIHKKRILNDNLEIIGHSEEFYLTENKFDNLNQDSLIGNLETLYLNLPNMAENRYTDNYSATMDYRVGQIATIPRNEGSDDNTVSCGRGLHIANREFDYSYFGKQNVLAIVNPIDVLAAPLEDRGKLRTSRWFFAMTLNDEEKKILDEDCFDVTELDDIFEEKCSEDLEEHVKKGFAEEVKRHSFTIPQISTSEIKNIITSLEQIKTKIANRVVKID